MENTKEFNEKYSQWLEKGHYGCAIGNNPAMLDYLDSKFQVFIKRPDFSYSQIKSKFDSYRFYAEGVTFEESSEIEKELKKLSKL